MSKEKGSNDWQIYIGNIPHSLTKEHIEGLFQRYNIVQVGDIICRGSKTFCFLKLGKEADVINAVAQMNNHNVNGRKLQVRQFEKKSGSSKQEQKISNDDTKSNSLALTVKDVPPPLETPVENQNTKINPNVYTQQSRTQYSNDKYQSTGYSHENLSSSNSNLLLCTSSQAFGYKHQNTSSSGSHLVSHISPQAAARSRHQTSFSELNKISHLSPAEKNILLSSPGQINRISPQEQSKPFFISAGQSKPLSSPSQSTSSSQSGHNLQFSADFDQTSHKSPEKYRYVHCSRNVISYNPRDLESNKISYNSHEHSSQGIVKIWVVNFPYHTAKKQILKLFEDFSPLKVYINNNLPGGDFTRATITLPSLDLAEAAIMELDNTIYKRRTLLVGLVDDDDEDDEFAYDDDYEEEDYDDEYYEPYCDYNDQDHHYGSQDQDQFYGAEPVSRRFHNIHLS